MVSILDAKGPMYRSSLLKGPVELVCFNERSNVLLLGVPLTKGTNISFTVMYTNAQVISYQRY